ncbi:GmrSD restriction endonuclease domain-containing protein [Vreelandella zhaodongensis]|uniref:GmrSD restriction endonuclease domain-containing protein n=1 Tax=Vreelandella zhaodongensis TaxID=1176240 RepID=UPI003EBF9C55
MSQIQQLNISLEGIGAVLKSRRFRVPAYQRSYAWDVEHVEALLDDIKEAIYNKEREYFLGSVVVTSDLTQQKWTLV